MADLTSYDERQLLQLVKEDNEAAFVEIYRRYWDRLFTVAMHRLNHTEEARELIQDVFFNLWKKRYSLQLEYTLNTYLAVAVKYEVLNRMAARHRQERYRNYASRHWVEGTLDTENRFHFNELQEQLAVLVKALPEKCRIIFQLSRESGYSQKKIAVELGIAEKTVEAHLSNALRKLRAGLSHFFTFLPVLFPILVRIFR